MAGTWRRWAALGLALIAGAGGALPARAGCTFGLLAKLPVTMEGPRASVPVTINGKTTRLWLDSGAFFSFMSNARAAELGLRLDAMPSGFTMRGIGGTVTPQYTVVKSLGLVGHDLKDVDFIVGGSDAGNGFLGANLLGAFDTEFDLAHGAVNLFDARGCDKTNLAYWAGDRFVAIARLEPPETNSRHLIADVTVNGKSMHAMFDTGAPTSMLSRAGAERAGIDLKTAAAAADMGGIGLESRRSWVVKLDRFEIGGETIQHAPIRVVDEDLSMSYPVDMILGADFMLAHHLLTARSQNRVYLTYNGGPIFNTDTGRERGLKVVASGMGGADAVADPTDADGFARRGTARIARGDWDGAIADLSEAIRRDPANADDLRERARAYAGHGQGDLARADEAAALALAPQDAHLLIARAQTELGHDDAAALADADAAARLVPPGALDGMQVAGLYVRLHHAERALPIDDAVIAQHREDRERGRLLSERCWHKGLANLDLDHAAADCKAAIGRDGPRPGYLQARALVALRRKAYPAAIADLDAVLAAGTSPEAQYLRGIARRAAGQPDAGDIADAEKSAPHIAAFWQGYGLGQP